MFMLKTIGKGEIFVNAWGGILETKLQAGEKKSPVATAQEKRETAAGIGIFRMVAQITPGQTRQQSEPEAQQAEQIGQSTLAELDSKQGDIFGQDFGGVFRTHHASLEH